MAFAGLLAFFSGGSTYTLCLIVAVAAYFGKVALYRAFALSFPESAHARLLFAAVFVPSAVFWSCALLKEAVAITGIGYCLLGMVEFQHHRTAASVVKVGFGVIVVGLFKAYILMPMRLPN